MLCVIECMERAGDFNIIHNHTLLEGLATAGLVDAPVLTALHGGLDKDTCILFRRYGSEYCTRQPVCRAPPALSAARVVRDGGLGSPSSQP